MGGCLSLRPSRRLHHPAKLGSPLGSPLGVDELSSVVIREAQHAVLCDEKRRPKHIQSAKDALRCIRYRDPHHSDLAHLSAVVESLDQVQFSREGSLREGHFERNHFSRDVFSRDGAGDMDVVPRHLHERLGLSHLQLRYSSDPPDARSASNDSASSEFEYSPSCGSSANSTRSIMSRAMRLQSSEYEALEPAMDPDSTHLLSNRDDDDDATTVVPSLAGSPVHASPMLTHALPRVSSEVEVVASGRIAPKSPQWLVEQCQQLRRKLHEEKKERLKTEEKLMRAEEAASKLHEALKKVTLGDELNRVVVPRPKVRASASRGSTHARQFKPITPPSGRCVTSNYDENSSRGKAQSSNPLHEEPEKRLPSPNHYTTPRDDLDGASSVLSSNSYALRPERGHTRAFPSHGSADIKAQSMVSAGLTSHISDHQAHPKAHSAVSIGTIGNTLHSYSPVASPSQPGLIDSRELAAYKDRRATDLTVRVMNGVSEEEIAKFLVPKSCFTTPNTFFFQLDRLCQLHAGHPLSRVHWLRLSSGGTERRHCNMRMLQELMVQPMAVPLYLSTVPMPSPAELTPYQPSIRLKSLVPAKITFTGMTVSVSHVFLETTKLPEAAYSIAFTDQWTSTTYIVEGFVAENRCGVYFGAPNALLKKEAGGGSGLYDVHLLVDGTYRSENRRALAVTCSDRAMSSNASSASFEPAT